MGNAKSIQQLQVAAPSHPGQWTLQSRLPYCTLVRNNDTKYLAEQYIVPTDPLISLLRSYEIYDYRRKQNNNMVEVYQVQKQPVSFICQGEDFLRVKTQRIPFRLSQIHQISIPQAFYILINSLIGYKTIYQFNGYSIIDDDMIGFSESGKVKVWISGNFAKNISDTQVKVLPIEKNSQEVCMITQIIEIIKEHIQGNKYPQSFQSFHQQILPTTFAQTLQFIHDYIKFQGIVLPTSIKQKQVKSESTVYSTKDKNTQKQEQTLIKNSIYKINQPFFSCGFLNSSVNSKVPILSNSIKQSVQIYKKDIKEKQILETKQPQIQTIIKSHGSIKNSPCNMQKQNPLTLANSKSVQNLHPSQKQHFLNNQVLQSPYKQYHLQVPHNEVSIQRTNNLRFNMKKEDRNINVYYSPDLRFIKPQTQTMSRNASPQMFKTNDPVRNTQQQAKIRSPIITAKSPNKFSFAPSPILSSAPLNFKNQKYINSHQQNKFFIDKHGVKQDKTKLEQNHVYLRFPIQNNQRSHYQKSPQPKIGNIQETKQRKKSPAKAILNQDNTINTKFQCTTKIDSVRPQIRKLMMKPCTSSRNIGQNNTTGYINNLNRQVLKSTCQVKKSNLSELRQNQIKNYLRGHSQVSPIRLFEGYKHSESTQTDKLDDVHLQKQKYTKLQTISCNAVEQNHQIINLCNQIPSFKSISEFDQGSSSNQVLIDGFKSQNQHTFSKINDQNYSQSADITLKITQFRENDSEHSESLEIDASDLKTLAKKNVLSMQNHILQKIDQQQFTLRKESSIPTYEELRQVLLWGSKQSFEKSSL